MSRKFFDIFKSMPSKTDHQESLNSDSDSQTEPTLIKLTPKGRKSDQNGDNFGNCEEKIKINELKNIKIEPEGEFKIEIPTKLPKLHQSSSILNKNSSHFAISPKTIAKSTKSSKKISSKIQNSTKKPKKSLKKVPKYETIPKFSKFLSENINDCKFCDKIFPNNGYIFDHLKRVHSDIIKECLLKCTLCFHTFYYEKLLDIHMKTKHKDGGVESFVCDFDARTFKKKDILRQHMKSHLQKISCKICNAKIKIQSLSNHMNTHDSSKNFKCKTCNKSFRNIRLLAGHEQTHDKKLECSICNKKYAHKKEIIRHHKYFHQDLKAVTCEICGKKFADKANLKQHLSTHDQNRPKPFKCETCGHTTVTMQRLKNHMKYHENEAKRLATLVNPKKCNQCGKYFRDNFAVYCHRISVHTEITHQCDLCGNYYKNRSKFLGHMRFKHLKKKKTHS
ncbi:hypothetical protein ACKWTF_015603 [Chironomus riparius]